MGIEGEINCDLSFPSRSILPLVVQKASNLQHSTSGGRIPLRSQKIGRDASDPHVVTLVVASAYAHKLPIYDGRMA